MLCHMLMLCPFMSPKRFWTVQIVLDGYKLFWSGPNHFGRVQIILVRFKFDFSGLIFVIWTCPKHGSYKLIIMHEKCGRPDSNGFQVK